MQTSLTLIFWVIMVAILMSLVRPGSLGGQMVVDVTDAFAAVVGKATGYT